LNNTTLYAVYESSEGNRIDTLTCDEKGNFTVFHEQDDNLQAIIFYYNDREEWFTVYPPEAGKTIRIKGDAKYPQLIRIKGSRINNKLSEFKKKAETILKEQADIIHNRDENDLSNGEGSPQLANLHLALKGLAQDFITKNPKEEASVILIKDYFTHPDEIEQTEDLLDLVSPELNDFYMVKDLRTRITKAKTTMAGAKAPVFNVINIYGKTITPDSFLNKYYVLAFTALWCDMCRTEVMMLDNIATKYPKDSLEILLISLDDETDEVRDMLLRDSIQWNFVTDSAGQAIDLFEKYNVNSLPKCFLMDKYGIIKLRTSNGAELQQIVDEIME
jgi:peroxiredoxin